MVQTVVSQEESWETRTGSRPPLHCIAINPETERRNYLIKYEEITMALNKKLYLDDTIVFRYY